MCDKESVVTYILCFCASSRALVLVVDEGPVRVKYAYSTLAILYIVSWPRH